MRSMRAVFWLYVTIIVTGIAFYAAIGLVNP